MTPSGPSSSPGSKPVRQRRPRHRAPWIPRNPQKQSVATIGETGAQELYKVRRLGALIHEFSEKAD
jgi:hypothetical protein